MKPEIRKGLRTIVASREFTKRAGRKSARVRIEIGTPQHLPAEPGLSDWWACPIRIRGLGQPMLAYAGGVDGVQALELSMRHASQMLSGTKAFNNGEIYWGKTPLTQDLDFALPLSLARLQSAVEMTLSVLRKRRKSLSREAERAFRAMLKEAVRSLAACATHARRAESSENAKGEVPRRLRRRAMAG
jgi:hypothetical protein